jgi:hypothetical protein
MFKVSDMLGKELKTPKAFWFVDTPEMAIGKKYRVQ